MNNTFQLQALASPLDISGPVLLVIMDGVGLGRHDEVTRFFAPTHPTWIVCLAKH